jgi:lipopolysaccharide transport system ATP-binding protein
MTLSKNTAIQVEGLGKQYKIGQTKRSHDTLRDSIMHGFSGMFGRSKFAANGNGKNGNSDRFWALKDVSFEVKPGEIVGIIGRNGAGKSTLLKTLARITEPTEGSIDIFGRVGSLLEVGTGFHQELTGRENVFLSGSILGMRKAEIHRHFDEIVDFAEVEKFIDMPVKHYSSGMYLRLAFGVAAFLQPEILLIDEVLAVGDAVFQKKCLGKMGDVSKQGRTVLFVSHNMGAVQELCQRGILLESGRVAFDGSAIDCVGEYYTRTNSSSYKEDNQDAGRPMEVTELKVNGSLDPVIESGKSFEVSLTLKGREIKNPRMFLIIENILGQTLVHSQVFSKEIGLEQIDGSYTLHLSIPALWLSPGIYSMYFKIIANSVEWEGRINSERLMLEVRGEMENTGKALLHPDVKWRVEPFELQATSDHGSGFPLNGKKSAAIKK